MGKRLLALLLVGFLFALSACGNTDTEETGEADNIATEETQDKEMVSTEEKPDVTDTEANTKEQAITHPESEEAADDYVQLLFDWSNDTKLYALDLFEDGIEDIIQLIIEDDYEYVVLVNHKSSVQEKYLSYFSKAFLVKNDDKYYIYLQLKYNTDARRTIEVLEITKQTVSYVGSYNGQLMEFEDPNCFKIRTYIDTNLLETKYYVGNNGMPVPINNRYELIQYDDRRTYDYISLVDIPAELVDEQGKLLGKTYNFPAGTEFLLVYTDGSTYYDVKADDGQYCRHYLQEVLKGAEYHLTINGLDLESSMEEFPIEQENEEINAEILFGESMEEAYQEKFRQLLPYVSDDIYVCELTGEILQCNVKRRKITNQWINLGEVEFVVESAAEQFHHGNFQIPADTLERNIKQALGRSVGEDFVLDHYWRELYDDTYRYTILEIKKNEALKNGKETVEYGDTIRAICYKAEDIEYNSEFAGSFLLQVDNGVAKFSERDYPFSNQVVEKIEKEALKLPLRSGDSDEVLLGVGFNVYDEEYVYIVSVTAFVYGETKPECTIPEGWEYQFGVPKIGSFKEYTEESPACPSILICHR